MQIHTRTMIYLGMVFCLLVVPRALQRLRLPAAITCFVLGIVVAMFYKPLVGDKVMDVISALGIASLFLFAGLEVDLVEIRRQLGRLSWHLALRILFLLFFTWLAIRVLHMAWQPAALLALGLLTPSTGFILGTLPDSGLPVSEQNEVEINAIVAEMTALLLLFIVSQAGSIQTLAICSLALFLLIALTPLLFLALGKYVVPYAPGSEFSLLIMVGVICAVITNGLGVHFLIGAFVAGLVAGQLKERMVTLVSYENLQAVRLFASFFIPFYFFHEGLNVPGGALVLRSVFYGVALLAVVLPVRTAKVWAQTCWVSKRGRREGFRVAVALTPTLIFTLVIAGILHETFHINDALYGGLLIYATGSTLLPSFVLPGVTERALDPVASEAEA
jgi:Kef-type K+ transport system membrane component KefB